MKIRVKICGLRSPEAVAAAVEAGADAVGFVFAESPRSIEIDAAVRLAEQVPDSVATVAVMHHPDRALVDEVLAGLRPHFLQTDTEDFETIHLRGPTRPLPVYRSGRPLPVCPPRLLLFEGPVSGSGKTGDWETARLLARDARLVLAGGLDPANVAAAIRRVRPYAVDVSSGVETVPGVKDPELINRFVTAAHAAVTNLNSAGVNAS